MSPWNFIDTLLDLLSWLTHWRFNLCLCGGLILAFVVSAQISHEPLKWIAAGVILVSAIVIGWRWDNSH